MNVCKNVKEVRNLMVKKCQKIKRIDRSYTAIC